MDTEKYEIISNCKEDLDKIEDALHHLEKTNPDLGASLAWISNENIRRKIEAYTLKLIKAERKILQEQFKKL